jgi:methylmalonyl-CoA carboxyltransferase large subunit
MARVTVTELAAAVDQLREQVAELTRRVGAQQPAAPAPPPLKAEAAPPPPEPAIGEEELLAIAAAIGAFLGVRPHIRQIRLVGTSAWAQQGRVSIQASHRLQG